MQFNPLLQKNMHFHQDNLNMLHIDSLRTLYISDKGTLEMDKAQESQTMFFTTLHFKTN